MVIQYNVTYHLGDRDITTPTSVVVVDTVEEWEGIIYAYEQMVNAAYADPRKMHMEIPLKNGGSFFMPKGMISETPFTLQIVSGKVDGD